MLGVTLHWPSVRIGDSEGDGDKCKLEQHGLQVALGCKLWRRWV